MPFYAPEKSQKSKILIPADTHHAVLYAVIDQGTHMISYPGEDPYPSRQCTLTWEFPEERGDFDSESKPLVLSGFYTVSTNGKAKISAVFKAADPSWQPGTRFDLSTLIGKNFMVTVIHYSNQAGDTNAKISSVSQIPKRMPVLTPENKTLVFSLEDFLGQYGPDEEELLELVPKFIATGKINPIVKSLEWTKALGSDTIPF